MGSVLHDRLNLFGRRTIDHPDLPQPPFPWWDSTRSRSDDELRYVNSTTTACFAPSFRFVSLLICYIPLSVLGKVFKEGGAGEGHRDVIAAWWTEGDELAKMRPEKVDNNIFMPWEQCGLSLSASIKISWEHFSWTRVASRVYLVEWKARDRSRRGKDT